MPKVGSSNRTILLVEYESYSRRIPLYRGRSLSRRPRQSEIPTCAEVMGKCVRRVNRRRLRTVKLSRSDKQSRLLTTLSAVSELSACGSRRT